MARASTRTMLSLDRYAKIMGIDPVMFNGGYQIELASGKILFPIHNSENNIWPQYAWQNSDQVSREELGMMIKLAEDEIVRQIGYFPTPTWVESERHDMQRTYRPELAAYHTHYDVAGQDYQVMTNYSKFIAGGRRKSDLLVESLAVVYLDNDLDGFNETATLSLTIDPLVVTDITNVKVYYAGFSGNPAYEIRDWKSKIFNPITNAITYTYPVWMMVDPDLWEVFSTNEQEGKYVAIDDPNNLVSLVDVYYEYNDTTQNHVVFTSYNRLTNEITQDGGFIGMVYADQFVCPIPGTYNTETLTWERSGALCRDSNFMDLYYYSGLMNRPDRPQYSGDYLNNDIAIAIAYLATARLERVFYANNNATALADDLRQDLSISVKDMFIRTHPDVFSNPFGTKKGEWMAWRKIFHLIERTKGGTIL